MAVGIDDYTRLTEVEKQASVADLLKARSGVYIPAAGEAPGMKAMRPKRGSHARGTFWYYSNLDFNTLGTIFDQETGEKNIYYAFETRIADPIGMQDKVIVLPYRNLVIVHRVNTDVSGQAVDESQIGALLWLILDAASETEIGEAPFIELSPGIRLTAGDIYGTLAGSTFRSDTDSGELVVSAVKDGTLTVSVAGALNDTGKWRTEG